MPLWIEWIHAEHEYGTTMPVVPRIDSPPTMPRRPLRVFAASASPPGIETSISASAAHDAATATSAMASWIMRRGVGLMAGSPGGTGRPARVTVPTPSPARKLTPAPLLPARTVAQIKAPWVTSGSSPASLMMPAVAALSSLRVMASAKLGRSPRGKVTATGSGNSPVTSAVKAALAAAAAQVPVVQPRHRPAKERTMTAWDALAARRAGVPVFAPGTVWLAGAGPGDPGLLTLDALAGLTQADVVVHDALVDERVLALAGAGARLEFAGKRGGKPSATQSDISQRLVALARAGKRVLRLKGGDPFVFGRGGEEAMVLAAAGVPFRVIPGVTAGLAALAAAAIPATLRGTNRALIFAAGHGADEEFDWAPLARTGQPIVLYMVMHNLDRITAELMKTGLAARTPAAVIASATTPKQRVLVSTLEKLAADAREQKFEPPAIVVIGDIVEMRSQLLGETAEVEKDSP